MAIAKKLIIQKNQEFWVSCHVNLDKKIAFNYTIKYFCKRSEEQEWVTHGETYQEALQNAVEVMDILVEIYQEKGKTLPEAQTLYDSVA